MRVSFAPVILASLGILCLATRARAVTYNVTDLGAGVSPFAINASGEIVGSQLVGTSGMHAFSYSNGHVVDLGTLPGDSTSVAYGINTSGQIVGGSGTNGGHAFLYQGGAMMSLGTLPGDSSSSASAINDSGLIVGTSSMGLVTHAFRYDGTMHDLGSLGGSKTFASAVNSTGLIVGAATLAGDVTGRQTHAVIFGSPITDFNQRIWADSAAAGVNDRGDIVGGYDPSGFPGPQMFLRTADGVIHMLPAPTGFDRSSAASINNSGDAVGSAQAGMLQGSDHAVLFSGGQAYDLNNLIPANSGWVLQSATDINDPGQIVGTGQFDGATHGFLLTVPEPGIGGLFFFGFTVAIRRRRAS